MGEIFLVHHRLLDERRVVKVMRPQLAGRDSQRRRFQREAQTVTKLRHPNIALCHDFVVDSAGTGYMVMEFVDGINLRDLLAARGPLPPPLAVEIAVQTLGALGYLHKRGIIHRDISPENIMLSRDEEGLAQAKIIDLGIAKTQHGDEATATDVFIGKLRYSSPEQLKSSVPIDGRSDLYSLAAVLYELLTGRPAFGGNSLPAIVAAHMETGPEPFESTDPGDRIAAPVRHALRRGLSRAREDRYETAREFADALRTALPAAPSKESDAFLDAAFQDSDARSVGATVSSSERAALAGILERVSTGSDASAVRAPLASDSASGILGPELPDSGGDEASWELEMPDVKPAVRPVFRPPSLNVGGPAPPSSTPVTPPPLKPAMPPPVPASTPAPATPAAPRPGPAAQAPMPAFSSTSVSAAPARAPAAPAPPRSVSTPPAPPSLPPPTARAPARAPSTPSVPRVAPPATRQPTASQPAPPPVAPAAAPNSPPRADTVPRPAAPAPPRRAPGMRVGPWPLVAGGALAVAAVAIYLVARPHSRPASAPPASLASAPPPAATTPAPASTTASPPPVEEHAYRDYVARVLQADASGNQTLQILYHGQVVHSQTGKSFQVGAEDARGRPDPATEMGKEIVPETPTLVVSERSPTARCCLTVHVYDIGDNFRKVATIATGSPRGYFQSVPGVGRLDFVTTDPTFSGWRNFDLHPTVTLRLQDGVYQPDPDMMQKEADEDELARRADRLRASFRGAREPAEIPSTMLALVYSGHANLAFQFCPRAWPDSHPGRVAFLQEFRQRLAQSSYWGAIKRMNSMM
jgi:serine/threonine-protein kinase